MKKLLSLLLVLTMSAACLTACGKTETPEPAPAATNTPVPTEAPVGPTAEEAKDLLFAMYRNDDKKATPSDYQVVGSVKVDGQMFDITWTVDTPEVKVLAPDAKKMVTIDVNEKPASEVTYTLTGTITDASGKKASIQLTHTLPPYKVFTYAEYVAASVNSTVTVKGVITAFLTKARGNSSNSIYLQDNDGGYYVYNMTEDPIVDLGLKEGMTILVTGTRADYNGTYEITSPSIEIVDAPIAVPTPADYTSVFANATALTDKALVGKQAYLVTLKDVLIGEQAPADKYYYFSIGDKKSYIRISSSSCPILTDESNQLIKEHGEHLGYLANVTGLVTLFNDAFYLTPVSKDAFSDYALPKLSDAEQIAFELAAISVNDFAEDKVVSLPVEGVTYKDVKITWEVSENSFAKYADGKLDVTLPEEATELTLTAKATCGNVTDSKEIIVKVDAATADVYVAKIVNTPVAGGTYKLTVAQNNVGKTLYFTGAMNGNYLGTTDKANKAVDVTVEEVEGGYRLFFMNNGVKTYIDLTEGKGYIALTETPYEVFTFDADTKTFFSTKNLDSKTQLPKYLGCYKTYETISGSSTSYITGDNAKDLDVSQFPARLCTLATAVIKAEVADAPVAGRSYKLAVAQNNIGKTLYFTGAMNGNYLGTTDKAGKAVDVTVEEVEGGYRLFFMNNGVKTYIDLTEGKGYIALTETPYEVFTFDADTKTFFSTKNLDSKTQLPKYLGCYKTYETISGSSTSYITGDNAKDLDVSQFPARPCTLKAVEVEPVAISTPDTAKSYKLVVKQNNVGKTLYFTGAMNGNYLGTTDKLSKAADIKVEEVEGGCRLFFMNNGVKTYIDLTEGKGYIALTETPYEVFTFDADTKTLFSTKNLDSKTQLPKYLGCYKTYETISGSSTSYITGDNAKDLDVSQFPARLCTMEEVK